MKNITIDGVIFTYTYCRKNKQYIWDGKSFSSKEEMQEAMYESIRGL